MTTGFFSYFFFPNQNPEFLFAILNFNMSLFEMNKFLSWLTNQLNSMEINEKIRSKSIKRNQITWTILLTLSNIQNEESNFTRYYCSLFTLFKIYDINPIESVLSICIAYRSSGQTKEIEISIIYCEYNRGAMRTCWYIELCLCTWFSLDMYIYLYVIVWRLLSAYSLHRIDCIGSFDVETCRKGLTWAINWPNPYSFDWK